jgi:excisionase family DNA binding protein
MKPLTLTVTDTGRALGLGRTKIFELIAQRKLTGIKVGSRRLITLESIEKLVDVSVLNARTEKVR